MFCNSEADKAEEVKGPESNHSTHDYQATDDGNKQTPDRMNWPYNNEQQWIMLEDLVRILDDTLVCNVKVRIRIFVSGDHGQQGKDSKRKKKKEKEETIQNHRKQKVPQEKKTGWRREGGGPIPNGSDR